MPSFIVILGLFYLVFYFQTTSKAFFFLQNISHSCSTHFSPMFHFFTPWKRQETFGLLTFSGGIEWNIGLKRVKHSLRIFTGCTGFCASRTWPIKVNYFYKKFHLRSMTVFQIRFWVMDFPIRFLTTIITLLIYLFDTNKRSTLFYRNQKHFI